MKKMKLYRELQLTQCLVPPPFPRYFIDHFKRILEFDRLMAFDLQMWKLNPVPDLVALQQTMPYRVEKEGLDTA